MADVAALTKLIEPEAQAEGLELVRVKMTGGKSDPTLQVMAERPDTRQLTLEDCARLSRRISDMLDVLEAEGRDPIEEAYRLEVSSPGIDRPLTRLKDFDDWKGHEARIGLKQPKDGRKQLTGEIKGVEGDCVVVDVNVHGALTVAFDDMLYAKLTMTDKLIQATAPLDAADADEVSLEEAHADDADKIEEETDRPGDDLPEEFKVEGQD